VSPRFAAAGRALVVVAALVAGGCSATPEDKWLRARPKTYPTGGTVLVDGRPVKGLKVQFERSSGGDGKPAVAFGYTDARGGFRLRTFRDGDGAVAGDHAVTVEWVTFEPLPTPAGGEVAPMREVSHLPERYRAPRTSGLTATVVPGGGNRFSFSVSAQ